MHTNFGNCLDCEIEENLFFDDCGYMKGISVYENEKYEDPFSSNTFEIVVEDQVKYPGFFGGLDVEGLTELIEVRNEWWVIFVGWGCGLGVF